MSTENKPSVLERMLIPRIGEILFIAIFLALIGLGPRLMNIDGDLGRHITLGDYILSSRSIPTRDVFSFTKLGDPLTPHEWLSDVIFSLAHRFAGLNGIVLLTAIVIGVTFWLVYQHSLHLSNMTLLALTGTILGAAASSLHWLTRPHIFTILFVGLWMAELEKLHLGLRKNWIVFPLMMLIWVNLHGAFIAGFMIWGMYGVGLILDGKLSWKGIKPYLLIGASSFLVTLLNPDGFGIWKTSFGFLGNKYLVSHTAEYLPPDFQNVSTWPFLLLVVGSVGLLAASKRKLPGPHLLLLAGWTAMALYSARNIPLYSVIAVPILVSKAASTIMDSQYVAVAQKLVKYQNRLIEIEQTLRGGVWSIVSILLVCILLMSGYHLDIQNQGNRFQEGVFPVAAVNFITDNPPEGNGFNHFPWGGYLLYRIWPEKLVFIDGQTDFYGEELTREYEQIITLKEGWEKVLDLYDIQWVLMPFESPLVNVLESRSNWKTAYQDSTAVILVRE